MYRMGGREEKEGERTLAAKKGCGGREGVRRERSRGHGHADEKKFPSLKKSRPPGDTGIKKNKSTSWSCRKKDFLGSVQKEREGGIEREGACVWCALSFLAQQLQVNEHPQPTPDP